MERKANERARAPKAWIREGTEEEPVDFLDPGVVQRVVGRSFLIAGHFQVALYIIMKARLRA